MLTLALVGLALGHEGDPSHDTVATVEGCVAWVACAEGTCLVDLRTDDGDAVLVRLHGDLDAAAAPGRPARATGLYFRKVYPRYRMQAWQALGWHGGEALPDAALLERMDAERVELIGKKAVACPALPPPAAWAGPVFDLHDAEFESGGLGTGRKCLAPGASTPTHSTWGNQELLVGLEGTLQVTLAGREPFQLRPGQGALVPPRTEHGLANTSALPACYLFVFGPPAAGEE